MKDSTRPDHTLLIFLAAVFLFNSPLINWWVAIGLPWYAMYFAWAFIIALIAMNHHRNSTDGD